eukprot:scaffold5037_cov114-Isochrysis_galbana.AAC.13
MEMEIVEIVVNLPRIPTKASISSLKDHERARVEVGEIDVDPLLQKSSVIADLAWQPMRKKIMEKMIRRKIQIRRP